MKIKLKSAIVLWSEILPNQNIKFIDWVGINAELSLIGRIQNNYKKDTTSKTLVQLTWEDDFELKIKLEVGRNFNTDLGEYLIDKVKNEMESVLFGGKLCMIYYNFLSEYEIIV